MSNTETFSLSRPLKTHDGDINALTLQEPTAGAFIDHGEPFKLVPRKGEDGEQDGFTFVYDNNKAFAHFLVDMIAEKVDAIILRGLSASDFHRLRDLATSIILLGVQSDRPM
jgi:hypothetical protein